MNDLIIFIDDQKEVREIYDIKLNRWFSDVATVETYAPLPTTEEMIEFFLSKKNIVAIFVDEDLKFTGEASYQGVELISKLREVDAKIPIYIITSYTSLVDPLLGDIEFVIDKVALMENSDSFLQKVVRHISTYKDIKSAQSKRFDELLLKSLDAPLTEQERNEYEMLNVARVKRLIDEATISQADLDKLELNNKKLTQIESIIQGMIHE